MLGSYGLSTHIWNNRLKSLVLLAGFPVLLLIICFGFAVLISALSDPDVGDGIVNAFHLVPSLIPVAIVGSLIWFAIAWFANQAIVDSVTGAHEVTRMAEPRVWNLLENLCISRGIPMVRLRIIETDARNAFASGVRPKQYSITVTRGLMNTLNDQELEAVLGHELTHIRNRDVQLLVIAAVFVGIISLAGDLLIRSPRILFSGNSSSGGYSGGYSGGSSSSNSGSRSRSSSSKGGGGAIILILIAIAIFLIARFLGLALSFAMSRKREFLADAGSVELTKNPDAMITALQKISGHSEIHAPSQVQEMFLDHPPGPGLSSIFSTHPSIESRIDALVKFAGGHPPAPLPTEEPAPAQVEAPAEEADGGPAAARPPFTDLRGPWG